MILNYFSLAVHSKSRLSLRVTKKELAPNTKPREERDNANLSTVSGKFSNENKMQQDETLQKKQTNHKRERKVKLNTRQL